MGSEDLFHKRKARKAQDSARKKSIRKPYDRILIVCEGEKTEPIYFEEVRVCLELDSANIEIDGKCGSSPLSVVNHAYNLYKKDRSSGDSYNRIFCVFDRDSHTCFLQAMDRATQINQELATEGLDDQTKFEVIISVPSFEYWLLLHYEPTTKPYARTQKKSIGDLVIDDLKKYLPNYKKTQKGLFKKSLCDGTLQFAISNSTRILESAQKTGNDNPSTNVHILIEYLQGIKEK